MSPKARPKRLVDLTDEEAGELLGLLEGADSVELKLTVPDADHRSTVAGPRPRPARGADPAGVLLRYARARPQRGRSRRSRSADPG